MRIAAVIAIASAVLCLSEKPTLANGDGLSTEGFGQARAVPRSRSASRDAPAFNYLVLPRPTLTAFGEFAFFKLDAPRWRLRLGFIGGLELESENEVRGGGGPTLPVGDIRFWRGYNGLTIALELDRVGSAICQVCVFEAGLMLRHESEHYTGSNRGGDGMDVSTQSQVGDFLMADASVAWRGRRISAHARAQLKWFLPNRSSYSVGPGLDLHASVPISTKAAAFVSVFAETQRSTMRRLDGAEGTHPIRYPSSNTLRAMTGLSLPSAWGATMLYGYAMRGHRRGLASRTREQVIGLGIRFALGSL